MIVEQTEVKSIDSSNLDLFIRATEPQLRERGVFIAETANVCLRAIEEGYVPLSMLVERQRLDVEAGPVLEAVRDHLGEDPGTLNVYVEDRSELCDLTGYALVRGLWMAFKRKDEPSVHEFIEGKKRIAVLMDIAKPENVGAIFRSAAALGLDGVLLDHSTVDPLTRRVSRVSMGTVFQIPWVKATREQSEGTKLIDILKSSGMTTVAMALTPGSISIDSDEIRGHEKIAVVLGNEGRGLRREVIEACDYKVVIPMHRGVDSLNVAAASAISFWEIQKR